MKLRDWLERERISFAEFAGIIGRTGEAVRRYAGGDRIPERDAMSRIVEATRGEVTANDFFDIEASLIGPDSDGTPPPALSPDIQTENIALPEAGGAQNASTSGRTPGCEPGAPAAPDARMACPPSGADGAAGDDLTGVAA